MAKLQLGGAAGRTPTRKKQRSGSVITQHPLAVSLVCAAVAVVLVLAYVSQVNAQAEDERDEMLAR